QRRGLSALTCCSRKRTGSRAAITKPMRSLLRVCVRCPSSSLQLLTPLVHILRIRYLPPHLFSKLATTPAPPCRVTGPSPCRRRRLSVLPAAPGLLQYLRQV